MTCPRADDRDRPRGLGWSDAEILDIVLVAAARAFFSKSLDAMAVEPDAIYADKLGGDVVTEPRWDDASVQGGPRRDPVRPLARTRRWTARPLGHSASGLDPEAEMLNSPAPFVATWRRRFDWLDRRIATTLAGAAIPLLRIAAVAYLAPTPMPAPSRPDEVLS